MSLYRVYATIPDEMYGPTYARVGHTFGSIHKGIEACRKASLKYGVAELKDDGRAVYDRLLTCFRDGKQIGV